MKKKYSINDIFEINDEFYQEMSLSDLVTLIVTKLGEFIKYK